jgi:hypothetical protein
VSDIERQAIIARVAASPFNQAVDDLCNAVRLVMPAASKEDIERLAPALSAVLVRALEQVASTGARTATVVAEGLQGDLAAFRKECQEQHARVMERLDLHLDSHEAGK